MQGNGDVGKEGSGLYGFGALQQEPWSPEESIGDSAAINLLYSTLCAIRHP